MNEHITRLIAEANASAPCLARMLRRCRTHRLSLGGAQALAVVSAEKPDFMNMGTLAARIGFSYAAMNQLAEKLESAGLITRRRSAGDRRNHWVILTDAGQKTLDDILTA